LRHGDDRRRVRALHRVLGRRRLLRGTRGAPLARGGDGAHLAVLREPSRGMTKLFFLCRRRAELTHEQYVQRLLGGHVPLALEHHGMSRYVTSVVDERLGSASPPYDGFAEIQFASADDLERRLYLSAEGKTAIERDVGRFLGTIHAYYVAEHVARWIEHVPGRFSIRVGDAEAFLVY